MHGRRSEMETLARRQLKLTQKQILLQSHERILRDCLETIRLEKNKLQIEHLQLSSMIAEINIEQTKSKEAINRSAKEEKTIQCVNRKESNTHNDVARIETHYKGKGKISTKEKKKCSESRTDCEQSSVSIGEQFSSEFESLNLDSINSQELDLDVTSSLNRMLSGSFYPDSDEDKTEEEEEGGCNVGGNCYSDDAENTKKRMKFQDTFPDINYDMAENTVHSTCSTNNEDNMNQNNDDFYDFMI